MEITEFSRSVQQMDEAIRRAMIEIGRVAKELTRAATKAYARMISALVEAANDAVHVSGLEARYYVRGSFEADPGGLVRHLMTARDDDLLFLTRESRSRLATATIRGYVEHG